MIKHQTIQQFFDANKIEKFSEPEVEMLLVADYEGFIKKVKTVYRNNFLLLCKHVGVIYNFDIPSCRGVICTAVILKRLEELKKLNDILKPAKTPEKKASKKKVSQNN